MIHPEGGAGAGAARSRAEVAMAGTLGAQAAGGDGPKPEAAEAGRCERVRAALTAAEYNDTGITRTLGVSQLTGLGGRQLPALLRRVRGGSPLETLIRLFVLGQPAAAAAFARAAAPGGGVEDWMALGLVEAAGTEVIPTVQLRCYQDMVLAYDFVRMGEGGLRPDYVMGVSPSSQILAAVTPRRPVRATLDMGAGCGIQALLAARHSERVVGVDCNPRAVAMARFNARFNRIANVEFRLGDMFAPVAGAAFDLIVSNPPFIISPDARHMFLNSGWESDDASRRVVEDAPGHLAAGGLCVLNANWAVVEGEDGKTRLAGWFAGRGCDALALRIDTTALDRYASLQIQASEHSPEEYARAFERWMAYYAERRITAICAGVIALRRRAAAEHWFALESGPVDIAVASGADVESLFGLRTWLQASGDRGLLEARLRLAANVVLEQMCKAEAGAWQPLRMHVRRTGGIGFVGTIDAVGAALLARCDGTLPVREHLRTVAAALRADTGAITPAALAILRRLVEQGFLEPAA
jgi:methylase of polypeptide subunit release factors